MPRISSLQPVLLLPATLLLASHALAGTITGTVTNATTHKPASGDTVALIELKAGMQELSTTKADTRGHYSLTTPADGMYLVKATHQGAPYFSPAPPDTPSVDVTVYDSATKVAGIGTEANVLRIEVANGQLHVTESYFVRNASTPPRTQYSEHAYEVVLPADAVLEGAAAESPAGMPVSAVPVPTGEKGHYAFNFPIRPNEGDHGTRFQLSYHLPYSGNFKFSPQLALGADNIAVMLPKSMQFTGSAYQPINEEMGGAQTFLVRQVKPGQPVEFTVSGTGELPRDTQASSPQQSAGSPSAASSDGPEASTQGKAQAGGGIGVPIDTPDPLTKYKWWILSGLALLLAIVAGFLLRNPGQAATQASTPVQPQKPANSVLDSLKDELFALESERIAGKITPEEYAKQKEALETILKRALSKNQA